MNVKSTDVHSHEETGVHPRYAPVPKRIRSRDSFDPRDAHLLALLDALRAATSELKRMDRSVGSEGKTTDRASLAADRMWAVAVDSVNSIVEKMAGPIIEATSVLGLVANGA